METNNKMREALENSNGLLEELAAIGEWGESAREQIAENNAALAAPLRNCDVGTAEEQEARFESFCMAYEETKEPGLKVCSDNCPLVKTGLCDLHWAQMPYKEGGGK